MVVRIPTPNTNPSIKRMAPRMTTRYSFHEGRGTVTPQTVAGRSAPSRDLKRLSPSAGSSSRRRPAERGPVGQVPVRIDQLAQLLLELERRQQPLVEQGASSRGPAASPGTPRGSSLAAPASQARRPAASSSGVAVAARSARRGRDCAPAGRRRERRGAPRRRPPATTGLPSKSMTESCVAATQDLPDVQVAVDVLHRRPGQPGRRRRGSRRSDAAIAAARRGRRRPTPGRAREGLLEHGERAVVPALHAAGAGRLDRVGGTRGSASPARRAARRPAGRAARGSPRPTGRRRRPVGRACDQRTRSTHQVQPSSASVRCSLTYATGSARPVGLVQVSTAYDVGIWSKPTALSWARAASDGWGSSATDPQPLDDHAARRRRPRCWSGRR